MNENQMLVSFYLLLRFIFILKEYADTMGYAILFGIMYPYRCVGFAF